MKGKVWAFVLCFLVSLNLTGREIPSMGEDSTHKFKPQQLIAPVALVGAGAVFTHVDKIRNYDFGFTKTNPHGLVAEDIVQYVPAAGYYILNLSGVQPKHKYLDATVILAVSYGVTAAVTKLVKEVADVRRPNGLDNKSFSSGHSAVAFMGAEFLRMEYKDSSPWIGIAGYAVATGTALARIKHNEHWLTDVVAGAGIGILGTKVSYWVYPWVEKLLFEKIFKCRGSQAQNLAFMGMPYYDGQHGGVSMALRF